VSADTRFSNIVMRALAARIYPLRRLNAVAAP
jgi:hypothetical protein